MPHFARWPIFYLNDAEYWSSTAIQNYVMRRVLERMILLKIMPKEYFLSSEVPKLWKFQIFRICYFLRIFEKT